MSPRTVRGTGVSPGVAAATAVVIAPSAGVDPTEPPTTDAAAALERVQQATAGLARDLEAQALATPAASAILTAQAMMAEDPDLLQAVGGQLNAGLGQTAAIQAATAHHESQLTQLGGYMAERVADLRDVRDRLICRLRGLPEPSLPAATGPFVLVAEDLSPSQTASLDAKTCLAIATVLGGPTSHTAILAAQLGIPAVVGATGLAVSAGETVAVDGAAGVVIVDPTADQVAELRQRQARREALAAGPTGPGLMADGVAIPLLANLGSPKDLPACTQAGAEGVGLFRTEFLYLDRATAPSLEEQQAVYQTVLQAFAGRRVIIRTLDAGADKPLAFADLGQEDNPALGRRGLRLSMQRPDLLETQLQALAAAWQTTRADLWVMAPMVGTVPEADWFAERARAHGLPRVGVMVEVPAAALRSEKLLARLDFASLGTNDLAQYTMAADRLRADLAGLLNHWEPAMLELVAQACRGAKAAGKPIGVCGEAAGDPLMALALVGLGVSSLSMAPGKIASVRASLAQHTVMRCRRLAAAALRCDTAEQARAAALAAAHPSLRDML